MYTKISVTRNDIKKGCRLVESACPVARAIARGFPGAGKRKIVVAVSTGTVQLWRRATTETVVCVRLPEVVGLFISHFDHNDQVAPFSFVLRHSRI